ncbi:DUF2326 domain-containing protein, partial [Nostoc sp. NIES-2111]
MILSISASERSFKAVTGIKPGLNIVVASRSTVSTDKNSRNGTGKSSFVDIIHFCLGSDKGAIQTNKHILQGWIFTIVV